MEILKNIEAFYEAISANNTDDILPFLTDNIVWEMAGPTEMIPWAGKWTGHEGVQRFFILLNEKLAFEKLVPNRIVAQGDTIAVVLDGAWQVKNGKGFTGGVVHWITIENGLISRLQYYRDTFPIVEAIYGDRPFTVQETKHYLNEPVPAAPVLPNAATDQKPNETVNAVRAMYGSLQALNAEEMKKVFDENVVWEMYGPQDIIAWSGRWIGVEQTIESARAIIKTMNFEHFKPMRLIFEGDTAAVVIDEPGSSKATGLPFHTSVVHIVTANEEGKITRFTNYVNSMPIVEAFLGGCPFTVN